MIDQKSPHIVKHEMKEQFAAFLAKLGFKHKRRSLSKRDYDEETPEQDFIERNLKKMSDEQIIELLSFTNLKFYVVHEVQVADSVVEMLTSPNSWEREVAKKINKTRE